MKKSLKRALALMLACTIVIGSVYNTRQKAYASASTIIAGGGAAAVGVEVAFPYLLAITGVVAAGAAGVELYKNRDKIKEWGSAQFGKFKKWVGDNLGELGWYADAAAAGVAIAKWGDKLGKGTLDKSDPTWSAYKKWVEKDVCSEEPDGVDLHGNPYVPMNTPAMAEYPGGETYVYTYQDGYNILPVSMLYKGYYNACFVCDTKDVQIYANGKNITRTNRKAVYNDKTYWYGIVSLGAISNELPNYLGESTWGGDYRDVTPLFGELYEKLLNTGKKEYTYVGGLAPSLGGAGVLEGDWDVVGVGEKEDEKETKLPWVGSPDLDHTISDVVSGEKTWTDVLDKVGVGVIDRTEEGSKVIDEDGVTTKDWVYADSTTTVPDITIPNEGEVSKELKNYTFAGMEKIFPFCLPFDMIDFIKVLDATPQAPHFKYAFPYPTTSGMKTFEIDIDLSPFDSVAELLRDMECLLFIMGLVLVTRSRMIRG